MVLEKTDECIFCKILSGEIETGFVYQDDDVAAFNDLHPQAPVHVLIIPKAHIPKVGELGPEHVELLGKMNMAAKSIATQLGIADEGYRLVINSGDNGGQTVYHLHMHLLGGRVMKWPPG